MIIGFSLLAVFLISVFMLWYRISEKIPELIAVPDQVIVERLHEDSAKIRIFMLDAKKWYKEKHYEQTFWNFCGKTLYKFHILLLRTDNGTVAFLKKVRAHGGINEIGNGNGEYWKKLQRGLSSTRAAKDNKIHEVRAKK